MTESQPKPPKNPWNVFVGMVLQTWRRAQRPKINQAHMAAALHLSRTQVSLIETGRRPLTLRESILLKQTYGVSMETLLGGAGQASTEAMALLQNLSTTDQQEVYELFYRAVMILVTRRQQQHGEEERQEET